MDQDNLEEQNRKAFVVEQIAELLNLKLAYHFYIKENQQNQQVEKYNQVKDRKESINEQQSNYHQEGIHSGNKDKKEEEINLISKEKLSFAQDTIIEEYEQDQFFNSDQPFFSKQLMDLHVKANRIYKKPNVFPFCDNMEPQNICPCCFKVVQLEDQQISLFQSSDLDLAHLGPSYPIYFQSMKYLVAIFALLFILSGIYSLSKSLNGYECPQDGPYCPFSLRFSPVGRQLKQQDEVISALYFVCFITSLVFGFVFVRRLNFLQINLIKNQYSISDYSLLVKGIPIHKTSDQIKDFFKKWMPGICIVKVVLGLKIEQYHKLKSQLENATEEKKRDEIQKELTQLQQIWTKTQVEGAVVIIFETIKQKIEVQQNLKNFLSQHQTKLLFDGNSLLICQTGQPDDIYWENLELGKKIKKSRSYINKVLLLFIMGFFISQYLIQFLYESIPLEIRSFTISIVTLISNQILKWTMLYLQQLSGPSQYSSQIFQCAFVISTLQFINTTYVQFIYQILFNQFYEMVSNGTSFFISNMVLIPLMTLLQIDVMRWVKKIQILILGEKSMNKFTQKEIHEIYEKPIFDQASANLNAVNTILVTALYAPIIPISFILCSFSLLIQLYVNKYCLLRQSNLPMQVQNPQILTKAFFIFIILFCGSCGICEDSMYEELNIWTKIQFYGFFGTIIFASLLGYCCSCFKGKQIRKQNIKNKIKQEQEIQNQKSKTFEEAEKENLFPKNYEMTNPMYKQNALKQYVNNALENIKDIEKKKSYIELFFPSQKNQSLSPSTIINSPLINNQLDYNNVYQFKLNQQQPQKQDENYKKTSKIVPI